MTVKTILGGVNMRTCIRKGGLAMAIALAVVAVSCLQIPVQRAQAVIDRSVALSKQGQTDAALAELRAMHADRKYRASRGLVLGAMIDINLEAGRVVAAETLFKEVAARDVREAAGVVGKIEDRLERAGRQYELYRWCESLGSLGFTDGALASIAAYHLRAIRELGKWPETLKVLPEYTCRLPEPDGLRLTETEFVAIHREGITDYARALVAITAKGPASPAREALVARMRTDLLLDAGQYAEAEALFRQHAAAWREDAAGSLLVRLTGGTNAVAQGTDTAEALCRFAGGIKDRPKLRDTAADIWVAKAANRGDADATIDRLVTLRRDRLAPTFLAGQLRKHYRLLVKNATKPGFVALLAFCQGLLDELGDGDRALVANMTLDCCFFLERYDVALPLIEKGISGHDERWTRKMASKVRAHLFLQQGKPQEAVASFREFMRFVSEEKGNQIDPLTGTLVSPEMVLGLNAKRIGDILAGAADPVGAAKAYQEAREHYGRALQEFGEKTPEHARIKADMAAVPAGR